MIDAEWEDSLSIIDLRDLLYVEILERWLAMTGNGMRTCPVGQCRRHRLCIGRMVPPPGRGLPPPWFQIGERAMRPPCRHASPPLALEKVLAFGPVAVRTLGEDTQGLFLSTRIARRRKDRLATETAGPPLRAAEIISPALRAGLFRFVG